MTEKFEIKLLPDPYYKKYAGEGKRLQELVNIQFDIVKDGVPFDNGYNRMEQCTHLGLIMLAMDAMEFLDDEIQEDVRLWTKIPHFMGKDLVYRYFFDVHVVSHSLESYCPQQWIDAFGKESAHQKASR